MDIREYKRRGELERKIKNILIFPKSKSAYITFENGTEETVPPYIWNTKPRAIGDIMEIWQTIQSFSTTEFIPRIDICSVCNTNIPSPITGGADWENDDGELICEKCGTILGKRYHIDGLTLIPYSDYEMTKEVTNPKPYFFYTKTCASGVITNEDT